MPTRSATALRLGGGIWDHPSRWTRALTRWRPDYTRRSDSSSLPRNLHGLYSSNRRGEAPMPETPSTPPEQRPTLRADPNYPNAHERDAGQLTQVGRYPLTGEIGRGGMGVVYRAEDPDLKRPIAVK